MLQEIRPRLWAAWRALRGLPAAFRLNLETERSRDDNRIVQYDVIYKNCRVVANFTAPADFAGLSRVDCIAAKAEL